MTADALRGLRVLTVEDDGLVSLLLEHFLEELGCVIAVSASRLDEALLKARSAAFDVGVLDVNLAGELSYPVGDLLLERKIPFLFATGYGAHAAPPALRSVPILCKPYDVEQLAHGLRALLN